ncbi:MAG: S41 family peptidase [Rhabdochlamydiaceae bacterium]
MRFFSFLVGCLLFFSPLFSLDEDNEICRHFNAILKQHVQYQKIDKLLLQRAINSYFKLVDPEKIYLLEKEVSKFFSMTEKDWQESVIRYQKNDLFLFRQIFHLMNKGAQRAMKYRALMKMDVILNPIHPLEAKRITYLDFASTEEELKQRMKVKLRAFLIEQNSLSKGICLDVYGRERAFHFCHRKMAMQEALFKTNKKKQEFYSLTLKALCQSLDPHTRYFTSIEALRLKTHLEKEFEGLGIMIKESLEGIIITDVFGKNAVSQGVERGDLILSINGTSIKKFSYQQVLSLLGDLEQKKMVLSLKSKQRIKENILLIKERVSLQQEKVCGVRQRHKGYDIGYISIPSFYLNESNSCEKDILKCLSGFEQDGGVEGLIFDLRENSGGFLTQAIKVASLFISRGVVAVSKNVDGEKQYFRAIENNTRFKGPLIVLVSKASASASEIVAQTLKDYGLAIVVGDERTYGKGTIQYQNLTDRNSLEFFKVTVGKYYTPSGQSTQLRGVQSHILVPTRYHKSKIGEIFLDYALANDSIAPCFEDPLSDVDGVSKKWMMKQYSPFVQKPSHYSLEFLNELRKRSSMRILKNRDYQEFIAFLPFHQKAEDDYALKESFEIMNDMITLKAEKNRS